VHFCFLPCTLFTMFLPWDIILFLHFLSTHHKCTQHCYFLPCYPNPLLRRRRWTGILQHRVLGCALLWLPFLWCHRVFCCSIPFRLRVVLVFSNIIYVINILYSSHLVICEHFWSVCVQQLILGHTFDEYLVLA
jgi:hypothetical protein